MASGSARTRPERERVRVGPGARVVPGLRRLHAGAPREPPHAGDAVGFGAAAPEGAPPRARGPRAGTGPTGPKPGTRSSRPGANETWT